MQDKKRILRFLVTLLGAIIGTIPMFVIELRTGMVNLIAASIIGILAFFSYKFFEGEIKNIWASFTIILACILALMFYDYMMSGMLIYEKGIYPSIKNIFLYYGATFAKVMLVINTIYRNFMPVVIVFILSIIFANPQINGVALSKSSKERHQKRIFEQNTNSKKKRRVYFTDENL